MNASDIVARKQNQVLYAAYSPSPLSVSTVYTVSSIYGGSTQYGSTMTACLAPSCRPTFLTYEAQYDVEQGAVDCVGSRAVQQWSTVNYTYVSTFSPLYSTLSTVSTVITGTTRVLVAPAPRICP